LLLHQRLHCHRDAEVSLAGACRPDAEHDVFLLNRFDVAALHRRLWRDLFLACGTETRAREVILQAVRPVFRDLRKRFAQLFVGKLTAFSEEFGKILQDLLDGGDVFRIAVDADAMAAPINLNVEQRLEILYVLVVNAEERFQASGWKLDLLQMITTISLSMLLCAGVLRNELRKQFVA